MWLVHNNVPFDVAFGADEVFRVASAILMSEFSSGKRFDWRRWEFVDPPK